MLGGINVEELKKLWPLWAGIAILALYVGYKRNQTASATTAPASGATTPVDTSGFAAIGQGIAQSDNVLLAADQSLATGIVQAATGDAGAFKAMAAQDHALSTSVANATIFEIGTESPVSCLRHSNVTQAGTTDPRQTACLQAKHGDDSWLTPGESLDQLVTDEKSHYAACILSDGTFDMICVGKKMMETAGSYGYSQGL